MDGYIKIEQPLKQTKIRGVIYKYNTKNSKYQIYDVFETDSSFLLSMWLFDNYPTLKLHDANNDILDKNTLSMSELIEICVLQLGVI